MKNINLTTSMAFDAICTLICLQQYNWISPVSLPEQKQALDAIREHTNEDFNDIHDSFSAVCEAVNMHLSDPSTATLDDLCDALGKTQGIQSAKEYIRCIQLLKDIGFEEIWNNIIFPTEQKYIQKVESDYKNKDFNGVFELISTLKSKPVNSTTIYFAVMSYPVSFSFTNYTFVQAVPRSGDTDRIVTLIAHELMHYFSSERLYDIYRKHVNSNLYLRSTHNALITDMHSGDEEEHVMAAEYYILLKSGMKTRREILIENCRRYANCVPNALYIFNKMADCDDIGDLNEWLINAYESGVIKADEVISTVDSMLPAPQDDEEYFKIALAKSSPCWYIANGIAKENLDDIKSGIETLLHAEFVPSVAKTVSFCRDEKELDESILIQTLNKNCLTVDRLEFESTEDALSFNFEPMGIHTEVPIEYNGNRFENAHQYSIIDRDNIAFHMTFTCQNVRYIVKVYSEQGENCNDDASKRYTHAFKCIKRALDIMMGLNV